MTRTGTSGAASGFVIAVLSLRNRPKPWHARARAAVQQLGSGERLTGEMLMMRAPRPQDKRRLARTPPSASAQPLRRDRIGLCPL